MNDRTTVFKARTMHADEWLHRIPQDLVVRFHNDPQFHLWVKTARRMIEMNDTDHLLAEERNQEYKEAARMLAEVQLTDKALGVVNYEANECHD